MLIKNESRDEYIRRWCWGKVINERGFEGKGEWWGVEEKGRGRRRMWEGLVMGFWWGKMLVGVVWCVWYLGGWVVSG